ncbi:hypothetical protein C9374_006555 [Naegleria lovaniensis]|uniref:Actin n=1 Tax=Naegleria lovaniensis TaxID=51637 RepID=A0AA88KJ00_NAELO|nr:uncharacterized protein C9374_006555 [Naegleria lovaniensis]KAG2379438.1 hypothetical protein C9374_006555 [Naegleria lovaniensis]
MYEDIQALMIDLGSDSCKAGFAGDDTPRSVFPSLIGTPKHKIDHYPLDAYIGHQALSKRGLLNIDHCIQRGRIINFNDLEKLLNHVFYNELRVSPQEYPIMFSENSFQSSQNREKLTRLMFETFSVPALYISLQGVLSLYASGRNTGIVVDCGDGVSQVVPISEGYALPHAILKLDLAGSDLTDYLTRILMKQGTSCCCNSNIVVEREIVRDIKETQCHVALDYDHLVIHTSSSNLTDKPYELPDGKVISIGDERFECPEILFQPNLIQHVEGDGIHEMTFNSIEKCEIRIRKELYGNVVLSGGSTLFQGFPERMFKELAHKAPDLTKVKIVAAPERKYLVWIGGSIMASLSTFQQMWITKEEYEETGPNIVQRRCIMHQ